MSIRKVSPPYADKGKEQRCKYCGCVFLIELFLQEGHNEPEEYNCPECFKEYKIRACDTPKITLISKRTDGRTEDFQKD